MNLPVQIADPKMAAVIEAKLEVLDRVKPEFVAGMAKSILKSFSLSSEMQAWMEAEDVPTNGEGAKLVTPYAQSSWIYVAICRLAEKVASIPFRISRVGSDKARRVRAFRKSADPRHRAFCRKALGETIVDSGPVVDLFNQPHPTMNGTLFWEMVVTWFALRGEYFILPLDNADRPVDLKERNPKVSRLVTVPTELFWHVVVGYDLEGWRYTGSPLLTPIPSEFLVPSEVIYARTPNPYLYWRGMSPLVLALLPAKSDFAAANYAKGYWLNNADTGVIVTTEQQPDDSQRKAILAALRERKRKAGTADRPLFLWGGAKVDKPQLTGMEETFLENRKMNRQEIAAIYRVPDSVMGYSDAKSSALSGGSTAIDAEHVSWIENTITPMCAQIESSLERVIQTFGDDLVGWFDIDSLPIMQASRRARMDVAAKAFGIGFTINDVNRVYDLGFPEYPWGNQSYLPFNVQPVGENPPLPGEDEPKEDDEKDDENKNAFARGLKFLESLTVKINPPDPIKQLAMDTEKLWKSHVAARNKSVKIFRNCFTKVLAQFRVKTLSKLDEVHLQKQAELASNKKSLIDLIFSQHAFGEALNTELSNPILNTLNLAGAELMTEIGSDDPWEMPPAAAKAFLAARKQPIMGVGGTVRDQLNTSLEEGLDAGEMHDQLSDRIRAVFTNLGKFESDRVARTEVNMAYNNARHEAMTDAGIDYKSWLSSHGPNVRPAHAEAEMDYIDDPIPLDEPFEVGSDQMMYPGDDSLGADLSNIINCQCIQLAAEKQDEDEKTIRFKIFGVGVLTFSKQAKPAPNKKHYCNHEITH